MLWQQHRELAVSLRDQGLADCLAARFALRPLELKLFGQPVTFAHLTASVLYNEAHALRHAMAMRDAGGDGASWSFDADHCQTHLAGAAEHVGKLADHVRDNYPQEAQWLQSLRDAEKNPGKMLARAGMNGNGNGRAH